LPHTTVLESSPTIVKA
nr:immunoglobulin heavy chain junction region [Mus musculus]